MKRTTARGSTGPLRGLTPAALLLLGAWLPLACGAEPGGPAGPNVLLITVDSLRADHLGCYGYERDTSPRLDAFAEQAVLFERAYTHAPFTPPSHASLLTSLHVPSHGILAWEERLEPGVRTLGGYFRKAGWRTGAFYNHPGLRRSGVSRGFEEVQMRFFEPAEETTEAFLDWVEAGGFEAQRKPFAAWMHLWDVHRPYGWRDWTPDYMRDQVNRERLKMPFEEERFGTGAHRHVGRAEGYYNLNRADRARPRDVAGETRLLTEDDYRYIVDRYDGGIWYADRALGEMFDRLEAWGVLEDTIVVVTADHGESLTEREACYFTHDPFVYEDTLHVPLIVRLPGGAHGGLRVDDMVRGIDVLPTLLARAGIDVPGELQGVDLAPLIEGGSLGQGLWHFAQTQSRSAKESDRRASGPDPWVENRLAVTDGRRKLIADRELGTVELYDLVADPGETEDLAEVPERQSELQELLGRIDEWRRHIPHARSASGELSEDMNALLQGLGYVESAPGAEAEGRGGAGGASAGD